MPVRSEAHWLGDLAMTVALATKERDPKPLLRGVLREFLASPPAGHEPLAAEVRSTLKEKP